MAVRKIVFSPLDGQRHSAFDYLNSLPIHEKTTILNRLQYLAERPRSDWPRGWCKKFRDDILEHKKGDHRVMLLLDGEALLVVVHAFRKEAQEIREHDVHRTMINRNAYWEAKKAKENGKSHSQRRP